MFQGSYSNGGSDTVQYIVQMEDESIISGSITLPTTPQSDQSEPTPPEPAPQQIHLSIYYIIGISTGSVVLIAVIVKEKKFFPGKRVSAFAQQVGKHLNT
ncbi:MAG: hypothetical protein EZS28_020876 [Streblomastix strix]|uniref:Uncharacterized protein n=1 Tax=Streblomastix strix TaxID=222440 RepID=A0A5J4VLW0_9EUKA|nr:MAG: hypothetical protein EZS28_020876 [Streblomastix strix]